MPEMESCVWDSHSQAPSHEHVSALQPMVMHLMICHHGRFEHVITKSPQASEVCGIPDPGLRRPFVKPLTWSLVWGAHAHRSWVACV